MTGVPADDDRPGRDLGVVNAAMLATVVALVCAIGPGIALAIGLVIAFELFSAFSDPYEQISFINAAGRFAAEATGLIAWVLAYRAARGRSACPRRLTILGIMLGIALAGVLTARFLGHFRHWLG